MTTDLELRRVQAELLLDLQRIRHLAEQRIADRLTEEGLDVTPSQANVLMALVNHRAPMTARQLAKSLEVSEVTVGRFVRKLEENGWIERNRDPDDSRAILITPTRRAREALPQFIRVSNAIADEMLAGFDRDAVLHISRVTRRLRENLG
ncbi:MAG: MarR family transcriptional regulator [Alphaproteobacteria bacterium]|nr:MarR family transcriptional regulator [Alphaproteobacteria bacterium]